MAKQGEKKHPAFWRTSMIANIGEFRTFIALKKHIRLQFGDHNAKDYYAEDYFDH